MNSSSSSQAAGEQKQEMTLSPRGASTSTKSMRCVFFIFDRSRTKKQPRDGAQCAHDGLGSMTVEQKQWQGVSPAVIAAVDALPLDRAGGMCDRAFEAARMSMRALPCRCCHCS